jgi:phosphomannomutase
MTLIRSISGIRGTIGGAPGEGLSPLDVVKYTAAFGQLMKKAAKTNKPKAVIGRDARLSGPMVADLVRGTLVGLGFEVIDLGLATTPTVEMAVVGENAHAGIILTASHNPKQWNALKLLNAKGEFISAEQGAEVLRLAESDALEFADVDDLGSVRTDDSWTKKHIAAILGWTSWTSRDQSPQIPCGSGCREFRGRNSSAGAAEGAWAWPKQWNSTATPRVSSRTTRSRCRNI